MYYKLQNNIVFCRTNIRLKKKKISIRGGQKISSIYGSLIKYCQHREDRTKNTKIDNIVK